MKYLKLFEKFKFSIKGVYPNIESIESLVKDRLIELSDIGYYNIDIFPSGNVLVIDIYPHPGDFTPDVKLIDFININSNLLDSLVSLSSELETNGFILYKYVIESDRGPRGTIRDQSNIDSIDDIYKIKEGDSKGITLYLKRK